MVDVSVIFVNYNTADMCLDAVNSVIEKSEGLEYEIIVIDNSSPDGSYKKLESELPQSVKLIQAGDNLGFGKANNIGIEIALGEFVFLLNTDTLLVNNAIKILYDYIKANDDVGVVGGNLFDKDMKPAHSFRKKLPSIKDLRIINILVEAFRWKITKKTSDFNFTDLPMEVGYITGADMMIRKSVLEQVGLFDKDIFMYAEESELCSRILKAGYKIMSIPQAQIIHFEGGSFKDNNTKHEFNANKFRIYTEGNMLYYKKVYGDKFVKKYRNAMLKQLRFLKFCDIIRLKSLKKRKEQIQIIKDEYEKIAKQRI